MSDGGRRRQGASGEQFARVFARNGGQGRAAEHPCNFLDPFFRGEACDLRKSPFAGNVFLHGEVSMAARGDLREVGNAEDLSGLSERCQFFADDASDFAADVGVDFIEYEDGNEIVGGKNRFEGEHDA